MTTFFPEEFIQKYSELLGSGGREFFEICAVKLPKSIWVNSLKIKPHLLVKKLQEKGWRMENLFHQNAYSLNGVEKPGQSDEFKQGLFNLHEKASMIPALVLDVQKNDIVLDACAAPGNKTLQIACELNGSGKIVAVDKNVERFKSLRFNLKKFWAKNVVVKRMDILDAKKENLFDKILLDAPCSSEGVVRKDFDALRNWSNDLVRRKSVLQKKLIEKCFRLLKKDGTLVYSTCSFAPEENEIVVQHILESGNARIEEIKINNFKVRNGLLSYKNMEFDSPMQKAARIFPQDNDSQQFFIAKLRKTGS